MGKGGKVKRKVGAGKISEWGERENEEWKENNKIRKRGEKRGRKMKKGKREGRQEE